MIKKGMTKELKKYYWDIVDEHINAVIFKSVNRLTSEQIKEYAIKFKDLNFKGITNSIVKSKDELYELCKYDYYDAPLKGFFINEMINTVFNKIGENNLFGDQKQTTISDENKKGKNTAYYKNR